jgi:hypothetical protein
VSPLRIGQDYVSVDAVTWYVNEESSFFTDRMVSGTPEFRINGNLLSTVLGSYQLKEGHKTAPLFDQPIVPCVGREGYDKGHEVVRKVIPLICCGGSGESR